MSYQNLNPLPNSDQPANSGFSAQTQMGLPEVLQMCCQSRRSGQITFRSGESYGFIYIQHGKVLHAICGSIEGEEAVYLMLTWPGGGFSLDEGILPHTKTVTLSWEQLLFEGARRADEGQLDHRLASAPIKTAEQAVTRMQDNQPKLVIMRPDLPPITFDLEVEYSHVGRNAGNEITLPYPSISGRHCIFILSGPDIVLRDLNSSNGTYVNGEAISEVILRPGDLIQTGVVQMKFEPGIKRPKLMSPSGHLRASTGQLALGALSAHQAGATAAAQGLIRETVRLPSSRTAPAPEAPKITDDSAFVKGGTAISYDNLAKPEVEKERNIWPMVIGGVLFALAAGAAAYYFLIMHH